MNYKIPHQQTIFVFFTIIVVSLFYIGCASQGYKWSDWTGFGEFTKPNNNYERAKTLWDWLDLLIIPLILAGGIWWLNKRQEESKQDREIDKQKQTSLENYFDKMTELLIDKDLRDGNSKAVIIAKTRTFALLRTLDKARKVQVLQFLYEAGLINKNPIIKLNGANLNKLNLDSAALDDVEMRGAFLENVSFKEATLIRSSLCGSRLLNTNFTNADLERANFEQTILSNADFTNANLEKVNLKLADLSNVDFKNCSLESAILDYADLNNVKNLTRAMLDSVESKENMRNLPEIT